MSDTLHEIDPAVAGLSIDEVAKRYTAHFIDRTPDWDAFADARIEGFKRAQHRFIGAGGSGKHGDVNAIPPKGFTLSIMYVPPGQGNAAHTHEVEEVFFVLQGQLIAFFEDGKGKRLDMSLGKWDCVSCPAGVIHGYENRGLEPVYFQVMLGRATPELMGYTDPELLSQRDVHLREPQG
jgi:mannose-6-phosphate isomerase-like protein (cupin superfamily)